MADFPNTEETPFTAEILAVDKDSFEGAPNPFFAMTLVPATVVYFKMRALADPGPGYVTWVVESTPDFTGSSAPEAIQAGTAVVADSW